MSSKSAGILSVDDSHVTRFSPAATPAVSQDPVAAGVTNHVDAMSTNTTASWVVKDTTTKI